MTYLSRRSFGVLACLLVVTFMAASVMADRVTLSDGTVLYGTAITQGDQYWVKGEDGTTHKLAKSGVKTVEKGVTSANAKPTAAAPKTGAASATPKPSATPSTGAPAPATPATPTAGGTGTLAKKTPMTLATAQARCNSITRPMQGVMIWQEFLDSHPTGEELKTAQAEMAKWKALNDGEAEKINNKWVGGEERKEILKKADKLAEEGFELFKSNETLKAMRKFEECVKVYPNSFRANFFMGFINLLQEKAPEAQKYFDTAIKLQPNSPETMSNLGLLLINKKQYGPAIKMMHKAAEARDSKPIVQNLCFAISMAPPQMRNSPAMKPAVEAAKLLALKYRIPEETNLYIRVPLMDEDAKQSEDKVVAHSMWNGTGFIIDETGLILTNRHVAKDAKTLMLMMNDKTQHAAEVVAIDDQQDLALIRVKGADTSKKKFPFVQLAGTDMPGDGAECTVMGFPMMGQLGGNVKVTRGIVTSADTTAALADPNVMIDAKVNPGNSGGPILDRYGNVMAIVSMKSMATTWEDSYGLGISAGNIRKFLAKNKVTMTAGPTIGMPLNAEEIAAKVKPATVCILGMTD
jgi:S1-C subfamily serine protease